MNTTVNPIPIYDEEKKKNLHKYDLDYGVYFTEKENEDNKKKNNAVPKYMVCTAREPTRNAKFKSR